MDVHFSYMVPRNALGKQPLYCMQSPQLLDNVKYDALEASKYILRNPVQNATQHVPPCSQHDVNTEWYPHYPHARTAHRSHSTLSMHLYV